MSRRLINGRDWQLLTTAVGSGIRHFSSSSSWDHKDVVVNYSETRSPIDALYSDWYQHMEKENQRFELAELLDKMLLEDNFHELSNQNIREAWKCFEYEYFEDRLWDDRNIVLNYEPQPLSGSCCFSGGADVFTPSGPGFLHESLANLLKSGMFLDTGDDTSMVQGGEGGDVHGEEANSEFSGSTPTISGQLCGSYSLSSAALVGNRGTVWDVCGYRKGNAGPSGGFFCLPYISSAELGMFLRYSSLRGCKFSSTWHHNVTHAISATDPDIGSAGTVDFLVSILEHNKMPEYFSNASTSVFFLHGGGQGRDTVPTILHKQIKMRTSSAASVIFTRSLDQRQPKNFLRGNVTIIFFLYI